MSRVSLRVRLILAVGVVALLALALADVAVYASLRSYLYRQVDSTLQVAQRSVEAAATRPSPTGPPGAATPPGHDQPPRGTNFCAIGRESAPGMFIEVLTPAGRVVNGDECPAFAPGHKAYSPTLASVVASLPAKPGSQEATRSFTVASTSGGPSFRVHAVQLPGGDLLVVADPTSGITSTLDRLLLLELSVTAAALAVAVLVGLWLVRIGLRPLRDVVRTAEAITGGDLVHRVPNADARTEMGRVAEALNVMLERIQSGFDELQASKTRLRRFVSDASHELRTPIAAVSAYAQLFSHGAAHGGDDLGRVMSGIEHETGRMARLVEDLLVLARFDEQPPLESELVELVGLVMESVQTARMMGPEWPIAFEAGDVVEVMGDPVALRQVVDNLLKNVRAHTPAGTATIVRVAQVDDRAVIEVEDDGPGLDDDDVALVFERFFRSDPSRSRHTGGAGLGLAIVASIVNAHGGAVEVGRGESGGALFRVVLQLRRSCWPTQASVPSAYRFATGASVNIITPCGAPE
jgi:two-component system, OmpR family, sensor kinase